MKIINNDRIDGAKLWYRKRGIRGLFSRSVQFALGTVVVNMVVEGYGNCLLDRDGFIEYCNQECVWMFKDDISQLNTLSYKELTPDLDTNTHLKEKSLRYNFETPFVAELENVLVMGPHATVITNGGKVTMDLVSNQMGRNRWMLDAAIARSPRLVASALDGDNQSVRENSLSVGMLFYYHSNNFYHWVIEQLFKLRWIDHYIEQTGRTPIPIVPANAPTYVLDFLQLYGYNRSDIYEWGGNPLKLDRLVVPSLPEPTPPTFDWLQTNIVDKVTSSPLDADWIYISRQDATRGRRVVNYNEVAKVLETYDVEPINAAEYNIEEQIAIFADAKGVIGPHGAGMTNIVWGTDLSVIEIFNRAVSDPYFIIAELKEHDYWALSGESIGTEDLELYNDIRVDVDELERTIQNAMKDY